MCPIILSCHHSHVRTPANAYRMTRPCQSYLSLFSPCFGVYLLTQQIHKRGMFRVLRIWLICHHLSILYVFSSPKLIGSHKKHAELHGFSNLPFLHLISAAWHRQDDEALEPVAKSGGFCLQKFAPRIYGFSTINSRVCDASLPVWDITYWIP